MNRRTANRKTRVRGTATLAYDYDNANRLNAIYQNSLSGAMLTAFVWNDNGSLTKQCNGGTVTRTSTSCTGNTIKTYGWNGKNQLTWSLIPGKTTNTYQYDPEAYRVGKADSQGDRTYLLEGEHLEAVYQGTTLQAKFMRGSVIDEIINGYQRDTSGNWTNTTYHHDPLQSVVALSGHNGELYNATVYSAFGEIQSEGNQVLNTLKYTGREQDPDTGCYYYRARYYCPDIGRFISEDPKGFAAGINFYAYVGNNPVNANDPLGEYADVAVNGNNVNITIPILYTGWGKTDRNVAAYTRGIENVWRGQIGDYNVTTTVQQLSLVESAFRTVQSWFTGVNEQNVINILPPQALPSVITMKGGAAGVSCSSGGGCEGWWPSISAPGLTLPVIGAHEAGHLLGLDHINNPMNIMFPQAPGIQVSSGLIDNIINNYNSGWPTLGANLSWGGDITLPSASYLDYGYYSSDPLGYFGAWDWAGGGFLIYPNKTNANQMRRVYSK